MGLELVIGQIVPGAPGVPEAQESSHLIRDSNAHSGPLGGGKPLQSSLETPAR